MTNDPTKYPEGYDESNMLGNIIGVISDRTGEIEQVVAKKIADHYGDGDFYLAEDKIWDRVGPMLDEIQDAIGLEWAT